MSKDDTEILVCRCEEVTLAAIEEAIENGARTLNEVKRATHAGMGLCQGRTCSRLIAKILAEKTGRPAEEILPIGARRPVRPVRLSVFEESEDAEANS